MLLLGVSLEKKKRARERKNALSFVRFLKQKVENSRAVVSNKR